MNTALNIPGNAPLVGTDGRISPVWWQFFVGLFNRTGGTSGGDLSDILSSIKSLANDVHSLEAETEAGPPAAVVMAAVIALLARVDAQLAHGSVALGTQHDERGETGDASGIAHLRARIDHLEALIEQMAGNAASARLDELESVASAGVAQNTDAMVTSVATRTGDVNLAVADVSGAAPSASPTLTGAVGVGAAGDANNALFVGGSLAGTGTSQYGAQNNVEFNASATANGFTYIASPRLKAAAFNMASLYGFLANTPSLGTGSTLGVYEAFVVQDFGSATTRNAGLRMKMAAGTTKWNIYADGTAKSYHAGTFQLGSTTDDGSGNKLQVTTGISITPATTTTAPAAGAAGALPATPTGYATIRIGGTDRKIAYY
jgi:hypothetical protein